MSPVLFAPLMLTLAGLYTLPDGGFRLITAVGGGASCPASGSGDSSPSSGGEGSCPAVGGVGSRFGASVISQALSVATDRTASNKKQILFTGAYSTRRCVNDKAF